MQPFDTCSHRSGMVHSISAWAHLARWYISEREPVFACGYDGRAAFGFRLGRLGLSTAILIPLCERSYRALAGSVWQIRFLHRQHVDRTLLCFPLLFALTSFLSCCCAVLGSCCSAVLLCCLLSCFSPLLSFPGLLLLVLFHHPLTSCHFQIPSGDTLAACKSQWSFWSLKWATFKTAGNWFYFSVEFILWHIEKLNGVTT